MKQRIQIFLRRFSFRTGIIILALCVPCYIISFAQMALPISAATKGVLWFVFFGLAKTFQYGGLTILGVDGVKRIKAWWKSKKIKPINPYSYGNIKRKTLRKLQVES